MPTQPQIKEKALLMKEGFTLFNITYKMGVYHAFRHNDNASARRFIAEVKREGLLTFGTLDDDMKMNLRAWVGELIKLIYQYPNGNNKRLTKLETQLQIALNTLDWFRLATLVLARDFYFLGIEAYTKRTARAEVAEFMQTPIMDWESGKKENMDWLCAQTVRLTAVHLDDHLTTSDYSQLGKAKINWDIDVWFNDIHNKIGYYARNKHGR